MQWLLVDEANEAAVFFVKSCRDIYFIYHRQFICFKIFKDVIMLLVQADRAELLSFS